MNPLLLQIAIGAGSFILGFAVATGLAGKRVRNTRKRAQEQGDDYASQLAVKKLRIRELEAKLAERAGDTEAGDAAPLDRLASLRQVPPVQGADPGWLRGTMERPQSGEGAAPPAGR